MLSRPDGRATHEAKRPESVVVYGAGPVGLLTAYSAILKGASQVMVVDRHADRLRLAEKIGAIPVDDAKGSPVEQVLELTGGEGADSLCAAAAPAPRALCPRIGKLFLQRFSWLFQDTSFFLQGQMDIHPASRWPTPCAAATGGSSPPGENRPVCNLELWDNTRRDMLALVLRTVITREIPGSFAEVGVYKGFTARLIHHYAPERVLHLFDTFEGFTTRSSERELREIGHSASMFSDTYGFEPEEPALMTLEIWNVRVRDWLVSRREPPATARSQVRVYAD